MTEQTGVTFSLKEGAKAGREFIVFEEDAPGLSFSQPGNCYFGLRFREGTSFEECERIVRSLNDRVEGFFFTRY